MKLKLLDYLGNSKTFNIGDIKDISWIFISIKSGDEIATVAYKDNTVINFDSSNGRFVDYEDGCYDLYDCNEKDNLLYDEKFINRESSYDIIEFLYQEEE